VLADGGERASRPISRVLSVPRCSRPLRAAAPRRYGTAIHLRHRLPGTSSGTTRDTGRAAPGRRTVRPCSALLRAGFTWPAGHPAAGGLLPHHFTVATVAGGCVLSVALSFGSPRLGVTQRPALWSPDFPRAGDRPPAAVRPACGASVAMIRSPPCPTGGVDGAAGELRSSGLAVIAAPQGSTYVRVDVTLVRC